MRFQMESIPAFPKLSYRCKGWDRRSGEDIIDSLTLSYDTQVVGLYLGSNPLRVNFLVAKSEDYTTALQHLQITIHSIETKVNV